MDLGSGPANNSPVIQADPNQARFVAMAHRLDAPDFGCGLSLSGDGGRRWAPARPIAALPPGAEKCYAPEVGFDGAGTLYYLFVGLAGAGNEPMGAFLTTSKDRGRSFAAPHRVLGPLNFGVRMAIDATMGQMGRLHLVWLHATSDPPLGGFGSPPNPILAAHSDDGGRSFSEPVQVSDGGREKVTAPALALGPGRAVHVGYYDLGDDARDYHGLEGPVWEGRWALVVSSSFDGGGRFGPGVVAEEAVVPFERVMLVFTMAPPALVAEDRRVCVGWADSRLGDADAWVRCSPDAGRTWNRPHRINDDARANTRAQYLPRLAMAANGRLDAIFLDRRGDADNVRNDVFYTYSTNDGRSFAPNLKLTQEPSNSQVGPSYANVSSRGLVEIGSRLGLMSTPSRVVAAWPDTRNSRPRTT
ncbi:MAG TPA: hypothetical protein VEI97_19060, partial [bacterium]|nr:hypothetical protein [bacterium]